MPKPLVKLSDQQKKSLEEHGHPEAWFVCTTANSVTLECDHCDQVLIVITNDPAICQQRSTTLPEYDG